MLTIKVYNSFEEINLDKYFSFFEKNCFNIFYHPDFLISCEKFPLLKNELTFYIVVYEEDNIVGFIPLYLQKNIDPFLVLEQITGNNYSIKANIVSHTMHCPSSMILVDNNDKNITNMIVDKIIDIEKKHNTSIVIINTSHKDTISYFRKKGKQIIYMWGNFYKNVSSYNNLDELIQQTNSKGRKLFRQNIKKFKANKNIHIRIESIDNININNSVKLCHLTAKKYGTEIYYPLDNMANFINKCTSIIRAINIYQNDIQISCIFFFVEKDKIYLWACGMTYDTDFSPYIISILKAFDFAIKNKISTVEIGRTNKDRKLKLGFYEEELFCIF